MQIDLTYDASANSAPAAFKAAMAAAAQFLDNLITNPITVNIQVGWGEVDGTPLTRDELGVTIPLGEVISYAQLKSELSAVSNSSADAVAVAHLPTVDPSHGVGFFVSFAQMEAWGLAGSSAQNDGFVGFGAISNWDFSPTNRAVSGEFDFIGVAEHELTHALGRISGLGSANLTALDLFQYSSPGNLQLVGGNSTYFSIDGGHTNLNNYDTSSDYADWVSTVPNDSFDAAVGEGQVHLVTATDVTEMNVIGFGVVANFVTEVQAWYQAVEFLTPTPTAANLANYVMGLQEGTLSNAQVQAAIEGESYTANVVNPVIREYQAAYDRVPDQAGLSFWVNQFGSGGVPLSQISSTFASAPEFTVLYGADANTPANTTLVTALYQNVLGRLPDAGGLAYWSSQHMDAAQLLQAFAQSPEFVNDAASPIVAFENSEIAGHPPTSGSLFQSTAGSLASAEVGVVGVQTSAVHLT